MIQALCRLILYRLMGWRTEITVDRPAKYIIALAPHTSNWDFIMGILFSRAEGFRAEFLMKKEWFWWPLGPLFRRLGGIPVRRSRHTSMTEQLSQLALRRNTFSLCITPEGTRRPTAEWKRGFYYIALGAHLPILLYGLDYGLRRIVCTKAVVPDGNVELQMAAIKDYYRPFRGKHPQNFII
ncbi:MAG: 1-acyl-sn-glycerol-3-phosphate acyltransferase [Bacteroidaceae bacterium]|nr:1-acyl-sn-glycerol-3-phosphate acyltransferase [Bacteroidaceae bacterium]